MIELADLYNVDIRELIDGERKSENMDQETKDTLMMAGVLLLLAFVSLMHYSGYQGRPYHNFVEFTLGATMAVLVLNMMYLSGVLEKIRKEKLRFFGKDKK